MSIELTGKVFIKLIEEKPNDILLSRITEPMTKEIQIFDKHANNIKKKNSWQNHFFPV